MHYRATHYSEHQAASAIGSEGKELVRDPGDEGLEDANEIVSDLAYWVTSCDADAALRITEGFGLATAISASMRSRGFAADAIALTLAEKASSLKEAKDAQHAGWLLLSLKVELADAARLPSALPARQLAAELLQEIDQIVLELIRKGTAALVER